FCYAVLHHRLLHSVPTRRSSDLVFGAMADAIPDMCAVQVTGWDPVGRTYHVVAERGYRRAISDDLCHGLPRTRWGGQLFASGTPDRKSTRLNSSHQISSYAVFCL